MTTFITDREAAALREDSLSALGDIAVRRLRPRPARVYSPVRGKLDLRQGDRRPRCRACTHLIENRTPIIRFRLRWAGWEDAYAVMHQECP